MGSFIARQPNGLYCRFSNVVDCPTDWNMTESDYIQMRGEKEAKLVLKHYLKPFQDIIDRFVPNNMTQKEFDAWVKNVGGQQWTRKED
jgi:hypothetical protein